MSTVNIFKVGMKVIHGVFGCETPQVIKNIERVISYGDTTKIEFESGIVTYVPHTLYFDCNGKAQYYRYWRPGGCEDKGYETISIIK
jgi:hypothetical protein